MGYDSSHYIFNDPLTYQPQTFYSKSSVEAAYKGLNYQAIVLEKKDTSTPAPTPAPVYKYGAVKNPETKEIYPIMLYENGKTYIQPAYQYENKPDEKKPTRLQKNTFNVAKFISGLEFDDSMVEAQNYPVIGNFSAILIGGITSFSNSWETLYIDVDYYKVPSTGQKQAVIHCGASKYCDLFKNWEFFGIPISMKWLHGSIMNSNMWSAAVWEKNVDDIAKQQYGYYKKITPINSYKYDIEFTFDERRKDDKYVSQIFCGKNGKMYEYATIHDTEKIEIVVTDGSKTVDRLNIIPMINPVSELPEDKLALFEFVKA